MMMDSDLFEKAIQVFREHNTIASLHHIHYEMEINPGLWWAGSHFFWGMRVRNMFRDLVCLDDKLPSGNWDDYYIQVVEECVRRYYENYSIS